MYFNHVQYTYLTSSFLNFHNVMIQCNLLSLLRQYIDGGYRRYTLPLTFSLTISPHGEVFYHNATIVSDVQEQTGDYIYTSLDREN